MHLKKLTAVTFSATIALVAGTAMGQVSNVAINSDGEAFAGHVVNDFLIDFSGQYTGSQMLVELTQGAIYQDAAGGNIPPAAAIIGAIPSVEWDTFLAQGSATAAGANGDPSPGGGAVNLGGDASAVFTADAINQAWNPAGGQTISDQTGFLTARLTLTDDATGTVNYLASAGGTPNMFSFDVVNGVVGGGVVIPEPSTFVLLGLGVAGLVALKRRNS